MREIARQIAALYRELSRRHVFRVAAVYAGVAFALLQGVDLLIPALGLPDWVMRSLVILALLGFPVALLLAWAFELNADPADVSKTERSVTSPATRRMAVAGLAVVSAAVLAFGGWHMWRYLRAADVPATMLAVMPFRVTGDPSLAYLGVGMVDLLSRNLDGAAGIQMVEPGSVLRSVGGAAADTLDARLANRMAKDLRARQFVLGSINEVAGRVRVTAAVYASGEPSQPVSTAQAEGAAGDLFALIDEISAKILAGLPAGAVSRGLIETAAQTTRSLPALRDYLAGEQALRNASYDSALASFRRAVERDTTFALAYYRIGVASWWAGQPESGAAAVNLAVAHAARLSRRDRRLLEAYAAMYRGEADVAERRYREILEDYPNDSEARFQLAEMLHHYNAVRGRSPTEAREPFNIVLAADPKFACPI